MSTEVIVNIDRDGKATIEVNGVQGPSCALVTDKLVKALGGGVVSDEKKPEFYVTEGGGNETTGW